jgi:5-methylcytosine-specific restriction endonuclease McrA
LSWSVNLGLAKFCSRACANLFRRKLRKRGERNMFTNWQKQEWKGDKCEKCGSTHNLELDHKKPRFAGGTTERSNAQTLCRTCNRKKFWNEDYSLYLAYLKQRAEVC